MYDPNDSADYDAANAQEFLARMYPECCANPECPKCEGTGMVLEPAEHDGARTEGYVDDDPRIPDDLR